ncbi:MAG: hypothetical protein ABI846_08255 [Rudaea sp.]
MRRNVHRHALPRRSTDLGAAGSHGAHGAKIRIPLQRYATVDSPKSGRFELQFFGDFQMRNGLLLAILYGGLIAGTLDIGAAALINMIDPVVIMRYIAGGLLGKTQALAGGTPTAVLGTFLQWAMSLVIAAVYVLASRRLSFLTARWLPAGIAYGVVVFIVMNYVVVPLSAIAKLPTFTLYSFSTNLLAMIVFGVIVAYFARRYAPRGA